VTSSRRGGNRTYTILSDLISLSWSNGASNRPATGMSGGYLAALNELDILQENKNVGAPDGTFNGGWYWIIGEPLNHSRASDAYEWW